MSLEEEEDEIKSLSKPVSLSIEILGNTITIQGEIVDGSVDGVSGTLEGPGSSFLINLSVINNGENFLITGSGAFSAGPLEGSVTAQIETDPAFNINPDSLNTVSYTHLTLPTIYSV